MSFTEKFDDYDDTLMRMENCQMQVDSLQRKEHLLPGNIAIDFVGSPSSDVVMPGMTEAEQLTALQRDMGMERTSEPSLKDELGLPIIPDKKEDIDLEHFRLRTTSPSSTEEFQWRLDRIRSEHSEAETLPIFTAGVPSTQLMLPSKVSAQTMHRFKGVMREWCNQKKWISHQRLQSTPGTFLYMTCQFHENNCTFVMKIQQANQQFHDEFELLRKFGGRTRKLPVLFDAWHCGGVGYLILGSRARQ